MNEKNMFGAERKQKFWRSNEHEKWCRKKKVFGAEHSELFWEAKKYALNENENIILLFIVL